MGKTVIIKGQKFVYGPGYKDGVLRALRVINDNSFVFESETYLFLPDSKNPEIKNVSYIHKTMRAGSPEVIDRRDLNQEEAAFLTKIVGQKLVGEVANTPLD